MQIGYVSLTKGVRNTNFKSCMIKNANEENLYKLIKHNLASLDKIMDYNIENNIKLFRISSDIIPFASSPVNTLKWWEVFNDELVAIGEKIKKGKIRVSMHPGQYTVLNSPRKEVVINAIKDLDYHTQFLNSLNTEKSSKIIIHIGGVYGDKDAAIKRFIETYKDLNQKIKDRLIIENDDKSYNIEEVLYISNLLNIPVVYDNLHNEILCSDKSKTDGYWIKSINQTWAKDDGKQKVHYSQQNPDKRSGSHSETINLEIFLDYIEEVSQDIDIMLEVKDKNISAIKCINALENSEIKYLEKDWSKYKYTVLEKSPDNYNAIRELLKDKSAYPVKDFYDLIEKSFDLPENKGFSINAFEHIWGYFKTVADEKEKNKFLKMIKEYKLDKVRRELIIRHLERLAIKYKQTYLLNSYYFDL